MSRYFPKPYRIFGGNFNVKIDLSNYATKTDLKNLIGIKISNFELCENEIGFDKLKTVPVNLSKLINVVNNDFIKKTMYDKLVTKLNNIGTTGFVLKTKLTQINLNQKRKLVMQTKKYLMLEKMLKGTLIIMLRLVKYKRPSTTGLVTSSALTAVENKILDCGRLVCCKTSKRKFKNKDRF